MKLTFLGATGTVTGSKYLLEVEKKRFLVDCGLFQGLKELRQRNWQPFPIDPASIDAVILTHAHIDHSGYLPLLIKNGFAGPVYCTKGTKALCEILLPDCGHIHEEETKLANKYGYSKHKPALPLYTMEDAQHALQFLKTTDYETEVNLATDLKFSLHDIGHIFGAAYAEINYKNKKVVFSGDIGRFNDPIMHKPKSPINVDHILVESTYGNRLHETTDPCSILTDIVNETVARKGVVIIPSFAVGRTQTILYYLHKLLEKKLIPELPIYVDSPMATNVSMLFRDYFTEHRLNHTQTQAICNIAQYVKTRDDSKELDQEVFPKIIISASGMATGGRVLHHLKRFLPDKRNTVLFVGYQADGTRGRKLLNGGTEIKIYGEFISVKAQIAVINNLSAHADYEGILRWLSKIQNPPKTVFLTHGETNARQDLQKKIVKNFGWHCITPKYKQTFEL